MEPFVRPAGPADAEEIAEVQRISWQNTYAQMLSPASLARAEAAWGKIHWQRSLERTDERAVSLIIESRDTGLIGFCVGGPRRGGRDALLRSFAGEIYLLYLLPDHQGRGHGVRLMGAMARVMTARGMDSALVWALAENRRAVGFYQHLDGAILTQSRRPFFGEPVDEIALGWRDLSRLSGMSWNTRD
jgi:ribosomal protein S18 acetylase RimI-like enzyme